MIDSVTPRTKCAENACLMNLEELARRFEEAVCRCGGTRPSCDAFESLVARYEEPHRHYHTLAHVAACLAWLERVEDAATRPSEVALALFFHDSIYDPAAHDNEERSAALAASELAALGVSNEASERVRGLVRATATHQSAEGDAALVVDIDLAILGASPDAYSRYAQGIRAEHDNLSDAHFRMGRAAFLRRFLSRITLFSTPSFVVLEPLARANLARELAMHGT